MPRIDTAQQPRHRLLVRLGDRRRPRSACRRADAPSPAPRTTSRRRARGAGRLAPRAPATARSTTPACNQERTSSMTTTKTYVDGPQGIRVPQREISLTNGDTVRLYDTSGPGCDPTAACRRCAASGCRARRRRGERRPRRAAARRRPRAARRGANASGEHGRASTAAAARQAGRRVTQLHYARQGEITPEMEFVALREGLPAEPSATRSPAAAPSSRPTSTTPSPSRW